MITKQIKKDQVTQLSNSFSKAKASFLVNCIGLNAAEITDLRKNLKQNEGDIKVIRNTLARLALNQHETLKTNYETFIAGGANAFVFAFGDAAGVAKVIEDMSKTNEVFKIKCGTLDGSFITDKDIKVLSSLPSLDALRGQLVGLLAAPLTKFVRTLQAVPEGFARVLQAKKDKSN